MPTNSQASSSTVPPAAPATTNNPYLGQQVQTPANAMPNSFRQPTAQPATSPAAPAEAAVSSVAAQAPTGAILASANLAPPQASVTTLPAGTPPLAFDGFCPVTLKNERKWVRGAAQYGAIHRGRTFLFTGSAQQQQFLANPDAYSPVFSGLDPVKLLDENQTVDGSRQYGFEYRGAFYLFSSQATMEKFAATPDLYSAGVRQAMNRLDGNLGGTLQR
jgi:protein disulfide-isomerase